MNPDDQRLSDMAHAIGMELHEAWETRRFGLNVGDPDAAVGFKAEMGEILFEAKRDPRATLARQEAALATMMARRTGRTVAANPAAAPPLDLNALAAEVYARRAATVREAAATGGADVPDTAAPRGLPGPGEVYGRRAREMGHG